MQHGLMVALWMAVSATVAFWFWRNREIRYLKKIPMFIIVAALVITSILCKSANGWSFLVIGCSAYFIFRHFKRSTPFIILLLIVPFYIGLRSTSFVSADAIKEVAGVFFDENRVNSLGFRLLQEDVISRESLKRPLLGWGGWGRGIPDYKYNLEKGITTRDSLWLITFNNKGIVGLLSVYSSILLGPLLILNGKIRKNFSEKLDAIHVLLSLVVISFAIDTLFNGMISPLYVMISGAIISSYISIRKNHFLSQKSEFVRIKRFRHTVHRSKTTMHWIY